MIQTLLKIKIIFLLRRVIEQEFREHKKVLTNELGDVRGKIVDVGCGVGNFSTFFPKASYTGIDIDPALIAVAKAHYPGAFIVADAAHLPFRKNSFDVVLAVGMLHHLDAETLKLVIQEFARVAKKNAAVVIVEDERPTLLNHPLAFLLYALDRGGQFRKKIVYQRLLQNSFTINKTYPIKSGLWRYNVFVLQKNPHHD